MMIDEDSLHKRKAVILPHLDERQRRLFAAAEAKAAGYGGIAAVSRVMRIAASTIGRGLKDLEASTSPAGGRVRCPGGGRKSLCAMDPRLLEDLNGSSSLAHEAIPCRRCVGPARAYADWRAN